MKNEHEPIFFTCPRNQPDRLRRLHKGGGGGDGGAADRKATEEARVAAAVSKINDAFGVYEPGPQESSENVLSNGENVLSNAFARIRSSRRPAADGDREAKAAGVMAGRERLYKSFSTDAQNVAKRDLDLDRTNFQRDSDFAMARAGLSGGSREIDLGRDILDTYNRGILRSADMGTQIANNARSADDRTRVGLINSARTGLDEGSAQQQAIEGLANNARSARDQANANNLTGFFDQLAGIQKNYNYGQGQQRYLDDQKNGARYSTSAGTAQKVGGG